MQLRSLIKLPSSTKWKAAQRLRQCVADKVCTLDFSKFKTTVDDPISSHKLPKLKQHNKDECVQISSDEIEEEPLKLFISGSSYLGTWDSLGINGRGTYTYPNGVKYEGEFRDGEFCGDGDLIYPDGTIIRGKWVDGHAYNRQLIFPDGLTYLENKWTYCKMTDRRFAIEIREGLRPPNNSFKTNVQPTWNIPNGYYDTGDGFYKEATHSVYDRTLTRVLRTPHTQEQNWITNHCRTKPERNIGPCRHLYEEWSKPLFGPDRSVPIEKYKLRNLDVSLCTEDEF